MIVTGAVPVEVRVTGSVEVWFTVTVPKLRLTVLTVNTGLRVARPLPLRLITAVLFVAESLLMVNCPVAVPATPGANCTCSVIA